jgi:hypothetical protein
MAAPLAPAPNPQPSISISFCFRRNILSSYFEIFDASMSAALRCAKPHGARAVLHQAAVGVRVESRARRALARAQHGSASRRAALEVESSLSTSLTNFL